MKNRNLLLLCMAVFLSSCASEFNKVYKTADNDYKYEYAKQCFAMGKFQQASSLLQDLVLVTKGRDHAQECLYLLGMAEYGNRDYESASTTFKKYYSSYPKGIFAEQACFYIGQSLYRGAPEPRLDQTPTIGAINAYQQFLDIYPDSELRPLAQQRLFELQDNLVQKEFLSAQLYYNLGGYFGNINSNTESNYEACIITAQNALKNYPYSKIREKFSVLIMKSKFYLAENSSEERRLDRYRDAEDECYGFINEYPESKEIVTAEKFIAKCKRVTGD
ncbi:MAG: outer membrane protein assembly factor BamD [Prevotella sp.]|nr:outer membrane protein assembly factor BamD [Prevotella sp.]MBQ5406826.1 outer membrane protein assembly factor BamD [Prevotella sp.]